MKPSKEFDELFEEMKAVERTLEAKKNTWLALKDRLETKRNRNIFPVFISLAIIAIASFLVFTYINPTETEQSAQPMSNEQVIKAVLEREYNGPDMEISRLLNEWWDLQSSTKAETQEEYDQLLESNEYKGFMNYYQTTFGDYFTENMLSNAISSNLVFKYNHYLIDNDIKMNLENVQINQEKDHPNIYRPLIEVSLTNSQGQQIIHKVREEFIFSKSEPGKIGSYNGVKDGGGLELQEKIENFDAYVGDIKTPSIDVSFDTLCFNGRIVDQEEKVKFKSGCTSNNNKINAILKNFEYLSVKEATEAESRERAEALPLINNYQISLSNAADKETILYTITLFEGGIVMFSPGSDFGTNGGITTEPDRMVYEMVKLMLDEFAEN
ncbi:hypothetical protein SAMN05518871_109170 [Psychrobacillus sp. OK028]|uniref:hypothetical protein n=1 Tax=Psychrobacillus sp. OK028 TaxID=1884359 RepID=UPI000891F1BA|nr:hypothetical protein [Psychrobacillus sp. OK028]SDO03936.1 hypothetical protein SAMN05518871_109170 [Psychrobacillus sp. OK028]